MQDDAEESETTAHVTAAHSSPFTPRKKRKHYTNFTTQSRRDRAQGRTRSQNLKITSDQTQTGPLGAIFFSLPWQSIKENISQNLPLVCKWAQDGLGALDSIWGPYEARAFRP